MVGDLLHNHYGAKKTLLINGTQGIETLVFKERLNNMKYDEAIKKLENITTFNKNQEVYIIASIDNKGNHIGRIKNISLDADCDVVIKVDIDKESVSS